MWRDVGTALGSTVVAQEPVGGGEVCVAARVALADGRVVFAKRRPAGAPRSMFVAEAAGLAFLRVEGGPAVPEVLHHDGELLVLEWVPAGGADRGDFGERLAALHRAGAGLAWGEGPAPVLIGTLELSGPGSRTADYAAFWMEHRHDLLVARGVRDGSLDRGLRRMLHAHRARLPELLGHDPAPARIHGDLWSGNRRVGPGGQSWIYDPAAAVGDREQDLAMMALFGGFSERELAVAGEGLPAGWEERRRVYQAWVLLVHVVLQGPGWAGRLREGLRGLC